MKPTLKEIKILNSATLSMFSLLISAICITVLLAAKPSLEYRQPTMSVVTQSLNTGYRLSLYRDAMVTYSIQIASTLNLTAGQNGTAVLQISPDNSTWTTVATQVNNNNGSLTLGLTTNTQSTNLTGFVPSTFYVRVSTSGSSTFTWMSGQQVLL